MAGQRQKHPNALVNKRGGRYHPLKLLPPGERVIPRCPSGVGAKARAYWKEIWTSPLGDALGAVDAIALGRYVRYLDEWLVTMAEVEKEGPLTEGRRGEPVVHPDVRYVFKLEGVRATWNVATAWTHSPECGSACRLRRSTILSRR